MPQPFSFAQFGLHCQRVLVGLLVGEVARINDLRLEAKRLNETMRLIASTYEEPE
ncbi:hypothetical protein HGT74_21460, partial [Stenotrophomonas maltophilia]|nr:hypothetical protein [Stenotrophomonas maltophilia]